MHEEISLDQIFVRVVEAGSLRAVALEMGVDPSSISRKVSSLEDRLQAKLLRRSTKRSEPTEAGRRYYDGIRRLLAERRALEADISGLVDTPSGVLRIGAPVDFGARFVSPVVAQMLSDAPELEVELRLGSHFEDLTEAGLDAVVRIGRLSDSSLIARKIGAVPRVMVASPAYIERMGVPGEPRDLGAHNFVFYRHGQKRMPLSLSRAGETVTIEIASRIAANSVTAMRELVLAGAGLHLGPVWAFKSDIAEGRLVEVLPEWREEPFPLQVLWLPTPYLPAKVRVFADAFAKLVAGESTLSAR